MQERQRRRRTRCWLLGNLQREVRRQKVKGNTPISHVTTATKKGTSATFVKIQKAMKRR